jgi:putative transposase
MYFITITVKDWKCHFGRIENDEMILNDFGKVVYDEWLKTPELRADMNLQLGEFVVMPNHFHGIIIINANSFNGISMPIDKREYKNSFGPQSKNLGSVIRGFKSAITSYANDHQIKFKWKERYHDWVIRSFDQYLRFSEYIINNPRNWGKKKLKRFFESVSGDSSKT